MPFLDDLIGVHDVTVNGGSALPRRSVLNFVGTGITATDNPVSGSTDVTVPTSTGGATITLPVFGSNQNDLSPSGGSTAAVQRWSSGESSRTVTGLDSACLSRPMICNVGDAIITLAHASGSSFSANRFACPNSTNYLLFPGAAVELVRDSTSAVWRVVS